ncbi:MAG: hypothetical protein Q9195_005699 [Heterodermia aff. obscurata]
MSNIRAPLQSIPNAANSPFRPVAAAASKRSRLDAGLQEDANHDRQPPAKKQALEARASEFRTPQRKQALNSGEDRLFNRKTQNRKPTAFERKLLAAREVQQADKFEKQEKTASEEGIRSWQKHYRRLFPSFVFYFESIPDDVRLRCSRQIKSLGAREEKFFSKEVTHIVTTRTIPTDSDPSPTDAENSFKITSSESTHPRTVNPSLLDRQTEPAAEASGNRHLFDTSASRKPKASLRAIADVEPKKQSAGNNDILQRAHGMGIKIWQLEKLNRVIDSINGGLADAQSQQGRNTRIISSTVGGKRSREADLSHLLRNEQLNGPSDRDHTVNTEELIPFRGYYLYIHDMDERTKPILVKEYAKVARSEAGDWPQFRANGSGKCPFVEDPHAARHELEKGNQRVRDERARTRAESRAAPRTRAETALHHEQPAPVSNSLQKGPLTESKNAANKSISTTQQLPPQEFCPPAPVNSVSNKRPATISGAVAPTKPTMFFGGEPAASGLQQSNVTSAIRSQMISSTAAAPGAKSGLSKEVYGLKRKVLERNAPALHGAEAPKPPPTFAAPARAEHAIPVTRQSRKRAQERLVHIEEESTQSDEEEDVWQEEARRTTATTTASKHIKVKDPKPGYCENCKEKYNDFDDHIISRKHRKFALNREHWKDLDRLLAQLGRPLREDVTEELEDEEGEDPLSSS